MTIESDLTYLSVDEIHTGYRSGDLSPVEVVEASLARIESRDQDVNAFITVTADIAREGARRAETALKSLDGELPRLFGVPIGLKDLSDSLAGVRNTYGSRAFSDFVSPRTADHVQRLLDAGAIPVGKTNTSEFGHKNTTDNDVAGPTSTPFAIGSNAGGSSGGSAAAVAAGMISIGLGSDGGGSIRVPAAACGVYGIKPTFALVPWTNRPNAFGTLAPMTHKGPIARSVADAIAMLDVLAQPHTKDPFGPARPNESFRTALQDDIEGMRVAYMPQLCGLKPTPFVHDRMEASVATLRSAGAVVTDVGNGLTWDYRDIERIWGGLYDVFAADTARGLAGMGWDIESDRRGELSTSFLEMIDRGMEMKAIDYQALNHERTLIFDEIDALFGQFDLLVTATNLTTELPNAATGSETFGPAVLGDQPIRASIGWSLTYLFNLTGHPVASLPVGLTPEGMPVGMQIVGPRHADRRVLTASAAMERVAPWADTYRKLPA